MRRRQNERERGEVDFAFLMGLIERRERDFAFLMDSNGWGVF
jgi:hypothetical protein